MTAWQVQEAKAKFSELVKKALKEGPQNITLRGEPIVVVISQKEYRKLKKPKPNLVEFIQKSPMAGLSLSFEREQDTGRDVDL